MPPFSFEFLRKAIVTNWPVKLTALVLSAVLWAAFAAEEPTTQLVPVHVNLEPPPGRTLTAAPPPVQALYAGSARELIKLYTSPPVVTKRIPDTLTGNTYTVQLTPDELTTGRGIDAKVQDIQPRTFVVSLDDVAQKTVRVTPRVAITPDSGYTIDGGIAVVPGSVVVRGPDAVIRRIEEVHTLPMQLTDITAPVRRTVQLDTSRLGIARVSPMSVEISANVVAVSERVLMGVPVGVHADRGGTWITDPPAVMVSVRGPAARIARLTRDSVSVFAQPTGNGGTETVYVEVVPPTGLTATATPDTVVAQRRGRG